MLKTSIAIQVLPNYETNSNESTIKGVDEVIKYIKSTGLVYEVSAFETSIEGELEELMEVIKRCNEIVIENGANSVSSYVKIVHSKDEVLSISKKVDKHRINHEN